MRRYQPGLQWFFLIVAIMSFIKWARTVRVICMVFSVRSRP